MYLYMYSAIWAFDAIHMAYMPINMALVSRHALQYGLKNFVLSFGIKVVGKTALNFVLRLGTKVAGGTAFENCIHKIGVPPQFYIWRYLLVEPVATLFPEHLIEQWIAVSDKRNRLLG